MSQSADVHILSREADAGPAAEYLAALPLVDMEAFEREKGLLPPLPQLLTKIDGLLRTGGTDVRQMTEVISAEPTVVARILRVVNSAYYAIPREISDIKRAVAFLGFAEIHRIVLTCSVVEAFNDGNPRYLKRFWTHSYHSALIARELAKTYDKFLEPGVLWPAALLHDIGELVYMRLFAEHYDALMRYREDHGCLLEEAEEALGLPSHGALGAELCTQWKLPQTVLDVCQHHHLHNSPGGSPEASQSQEIESLRRIVSTADQIAILVNETVRTDLQQALRDRVMKQLNCDESTLLRHLADALDLKPEVERLAAD